MKGKVKGWRMKSKAALETFKSEYDAQHQTRINRELHFYGRIVRSSAPVFVFFDWRLALAAFLAGYVLQFTGHAIEGTSPSFFRNPKHLPFGSLSHIADMIEKFSRKHRRQSETTRSE